MLNLQLSWVVGSQSEALCHVLGLLWLSVLACFTAGRLVGTHAHELMMVTAQLLGSYDDEAGDAEGGPVAVSALVSHLLFLRANGGLSAATALPDTFGTRAFVQVHACACSQAARHPAMRAFDPRI